MSVVIPSLRPAIAVPGWAKNELWRKAKAVPSLDLRFADSKSLVDATTGQNLVTFSRATGGTYTDSQGVLRTALVNEPRFDHNPTTGESLGLLVEEPRTNLLLRSEEFDNAYWTKTASTVSANATTSPSGAATADALIEDTSTGVHNALGIGSCTAGRVYTFSVFVKSLGAARNLRMFIPSAVFGSTGNATFNPTSGSESGIAGPVASQFIEPWPNNWYRCGLVTNAATATTTGAFTFQLVEGAAGSYTGNGTSGLYLWGAQLEEGSFPTSYIKNVDTPGGVTRAADVVSITTLGANVRSLFSQFRSPASGTRPIVSLDDNSVNERIELLTSGTDPTLLVTDGGVAQADIDAGAITANTSTRLAARFAANDFAASVGGNTSVIDTSGTMPTVDRIRIGRDQAGNYLNGHIARLAGWDSSLELLSSITQ